MIRHIAIYKVKDEGKKEEHVAQVLKALEDIRELTDCVAYSCGQSRMQPPKASEDRTALGEKNPNAERGDLPAGGAAPGFGDVAQVVDFETPEKAAQYPASEAHKRLFEATHDLVEHATVIDFEL